MADLKISVERNSPSFTLTEQKGPEPLPHYKTSEISGLISAPADFFQANIPKLGDVPAADVPEGVVIHQVKQVIVGSGFVGDIINDPSKSVVIVDQQDTTITLLVGYDQYPRIQVIGLAKVNPIFRDLGINAGTGYTAKDLANLLQTNMKVFESKFAFTEARKRFTNFSANVTKIHKEANDQKGNKNSSSSVTVEGFGMESITIHVPIFLGGEPERFDIDLECEEVSGQLKFFLTSFDLEKSIEETKRKMLLHEAQRFGNLPIIWS